MYSPEDIFKAARTIRPYLAELLTEEAATNLDFQLAELLARVQSGETQLDTQLLELLTSTEPTRQWTSEFLVQDTWTTKGYQPPPGKVFTPVTGLIKYACLRGDYVWYQRQVGEPIPNCPTHNIPLEKIQP